MQKEKNFFLKILFWRKIYAWNYQWWKFFLLSFSMRLRLQTWKLHFFWPLCVLMIKWRLTKVNFYFIFSRCRFWRCHIEMVQGDPFCSGMDCLYGTDEEIRWVAGTRWRRWVFLKKIIQNSIFFFVKSFFSGPFTSSFFTFNSMSTFWASFGCFLSVVFRAEEEGENRFLFFQSCRR